MGRETSTTPAARSAATNTAGGGGSRIFRAVEPDILADLVGSGSSRALPGQTGKYFFPTSEQAENFAHASLDRRTVDELADLVAATGLGPETAARVEPLVWAGRVEEVE